MLMMISLLNLSPDIIMDYIRNIYYECVIESQTHISNVTVDMWNVDCGIQNSKDWIHKRPNITFKEPSFIFDQATKPTKIRLLTTSCVIVLGKN